MRMGNLEARGVLGTGGGETLRPRDRSGHRQMAVMVQNPGGADGEYAATGLGGGSHFCFIFL